MRFVIENVGKITHADVRLDGITVICGENNTGKSTVGKALFSYFNSMCDWKSKIDEERLNYIMSCIFKFLDFEQFAKADPYMLSIEINNAFNEKKLTREGIYGIIEKYHLVIDEEKLANELIAITKISNEFLLSEYALRYFQDIFNNSVTNKNAENKTAEIKAIFRKGTNTVHFTERECSIAQEEPIIHRAHYIDNPFIVNYLNKPRYIEHLSELERNVIEAITAAKKELNADKMSNLFEAVANKEKLREVRELLKRAYKGSTIIKNDLYFYHDEEGNDIDFRSISTGLKAFALIERLLESGKLRQEDVLILDEPEIHLHPEWQLIYAELIVLLQKTFDLTILVVTHSFHFLESLKFFTEKYGIPDRGSFYMPKKTEGGYAIDEEDSTLQSLMESLSQPVFDLSDMKFEFEMEQNHEDEDDTE